MNTWTDVQNNVWTTRSATYVYIMLLAIGATVGGLFSAVLGGGPLVRALFGTPVGFHEHFTSNAAQAQALLVQGISLGLAFFILGVFCGRKVAHFRWAVWVANPITVGIGFVLYKLMYESLPLLHDLEYHHIRNGAILAHAGPLVFVMCCLVGMRLSNKLFRRSGASQLNAEHLADKSPR